ncbi:hypothetical protein BS78_01G243500 [Paspalum vaginatum]|nr:hypothetical protein BS78_01G243500 [Paspalum vaginatum]
MCGRGVRGHGLTRACRRAAAMARRWTESRPHVHGAASGATGRSLLEVARWVEDVGRVHRSCGRARRPGKAQSAGASWRASWGSGGEDRSASGYKGRSESHVIAARLIE